MSKYYDEGYDVCRQWVTEKINEGYTWDQVALFCDSKENAFSRYEELMYGENIIPSSLEFEEWGDFVNYVKSNYIIFGPIRGIPGVSGMTLNSPTDPLSPWVKYKNYLLGTNTGKTIMSETAVLTLEKNCHWIMNHLDRDTRSTGPIKGLVMGSVQSGKTANMIGLAAMTAHYDWNMYIILSGTIDNLRKQTRDRFKNDLTNSGGGGVEWHFLDYASNASYMKDLHTNEDITAGDLAFSSYQNGKSDRSSRKRYVIVCLKNSKRLANLIEWLHADPVKARKMRIIVIDDEADQASVNTAKMSDYSKEEDIERTAVNQLIIDLVHGKNSEGKASKAVFQSMNYISYTATPYANVLNEANDSSLYPHNFICSLPESTEYFGPKAIWGSKTDARYSGLNVIRTIQQSEVNALSSIHKGLSSKIPDEFKKSIAWFLCSAAVLRHRNYKKPISMLIHTTNQQKGHFNEMEALKGWLKEGAITGSIVSLCEKVYSEETAQFGYDDLKDNYQLYSRLDEVDKGFPGFEDIKGFIAEMLSEIVNIELNEDKDFVYNDKGIHLCVDNCSANRLAEGNEYLRIIYPNKEQLLALKQAPVFIVMGGNTLSRGLTLEGLVCTYFARNVNQADTLMQMARWFGYRRNCELLQRVWMPEIVQQKFELIEEIDEKLKAEIEDFMQKGKSPSEFGPRVLNSSQITRFTLSSKNKMQNVEVCDVDFTGDSYEITKYDDDSEVLKNNLELTKHFLSGLGHAQKSEGVNSAYVYYGVDSKTVISEFLSKYTISQHQSFSKHLPFFIKWIEEVNAEGDFLKWNVVVAGDSRATKRWPIEQLDVGTIERSKKAGKDYIDIGSFRSGRDVLADIKISELSKEDYRSFQSGQQTGTDLKKLRYDLHLGDVPLLLLYLIDKDRGESKGQRVKLEAKEDIVGYSIVIAGQDSSKSYVKTVHVRIPAR